MRNFDSFRGITRRALSINYQCPLICELVAEQSGSGSGGGITATLDFEPVARKAGPTEISIDGTVLSWSTQDYILAFVVYYSTSADGPFMMLTSNLLETHFDVSVISPGTYFFKATGLEPDFGETFASPVLGPVIL